MIDQSIQAPTESGPNRSLTVLFVAGGIFLCLCLLAILGGATYLAVHPYLGPQSRAVLAPNHSLASTVQHADLVKDAEILTARAQALGKRVTFRVDQNDQIIAEGAPSVLTGELLDKITAIGLLELVDFGLNPVVEGTEIRTDFDYPYSVGQGSRYHTVMTNAELAAVQVQASQREGEFEIAFTLTGMGKRILSDFSTTHIGEYLGIVMDKKVLSCPVIQNAINDGQGVIQGGFTRDAAESLAAYLRVQGPLPIPVEVLEFVEAGKQ